MGRKKIFTEEELKERIKEYQKKYYEKNRENIFKRRHQWKKDNPEKAKENSRKDKEKYPILTFRLSDISRRDIEKLAKKLGLSIGGAIKFSIKDTINRYSRENTIT